MCFLPGLLALGVQSSSGVSAAAPAGSRLRERNDAIMTAAAGLMQTCYQMYVQHPTGLAPEIVKFKKGADLQADTRAKHSLLRPETVESLFVMYRVTGDKRYQEWGCVHSMTSTQARVCACVCVCVSVGVGLWAVYVCVRGTVVVPLVSLGAES